MNISKLFYILTIFIHVYGNVNKGYSVIKEIEGIIYIGGMNSLSSFSNENQTLVKIIEKHYVWPAGIMNGSAIGFTWEKIRIPLDLPKGPDSLAFDNCLNWKEQHPDELIRGNAFHFPRWLYHTPSGDFETMSYTCLNSFIKAIQPLGNDRLWVCGTFGAFPRAFSVNKTTLEFIEFVDQNVMSCSRYVDEPMATYVNNATKELYVASGWGLYRPDKNKPDALGNNSTVLFSQWRLFRNLYTVPSALGLVLSSDVNFIDVVKETENHIYFFGHEVNGQYGLNNQDDRNARQSFMLRICKNDLGFKHSHMDDLDNMIAVQYTYGRFGNEDIKIAPTYGDINYIPNLPTKHFVTSMKVNFGCYIAKRPRAISDNHFWGETSVVYLNKLADVNFDPKRKINFKTKNVNNVTGCNESPHSQIPLLGLFNGPGIVGTAVEPTGALCQLQINENIFVEEGSKRARYNLYDNLETLDAFDELMAIGSTSTPNFFEKTIHRTNGFTLYPWWNQGVMIGRSNKHRDSYKNVFHDIGKCHDKAFYDSLNLDRYRRIQNFTNTAWPGELHNRLTSISQAMCQFNVAELYNFNATFIVPGVEFKKMFVIAENITDYVMHNLTDETKTELSKRRLSSPLMVVAILSTSGVFYRVVVCDFDNGMINNGIDKRSGSWYNWCIFRHTNQPYLYRQFIPMEKRQRGEPALYRASSLLLEKKIVTQEDSNDYPINKDPQFHVVKGVLRKGDHIHVVTTNNIHKVSLNAQCLEYLQCVDCASDPFCMWHVNNSKCQEYVRNELNLNTNPEYVQDVLDRGFKCSMHIKPIKPEEPISITVNTRLLHCVKAGFWRGNIIWKRDNEDITDKDEHMFVKGNSLYISDSAPKFDNISCYGVKDDYDKLFNGKEYDWIVKDSNKDIIGLNEFVIKRTNWLLILIIILIIIVIILVIIYCISNRKYMRSILKIKRYKRDKKWNISSNHIIESTSAKLCNNTENTDI